MLETSRLVLRSFSKEDKSDFYEIFKKQEVVQYLPLQPLTLNEAANKLDNIISNLSNFKAVKPKFILAINLKEKDRVIGWVGSGPIPFDQKKTELFYALDSNYWHNGYAIEAARRVLKFLLENKNLKEVFALVDADNQGSVKLLNKLNFSFDQKVNLTEKKFDFFNGLNLYRYSD